MTTEPTTTAVILKKFIALPLGARFRYPGQDTVWIVLERHGRGKIAAEVAHDGWVAGQQICSFAESYEECQTREVEVVVGTAK